jgi:hypothetical protein
MLNNNVMCTVVSLNDKGFDVINHISFTASRI